MKHLDFDSTGDDKELFFAARGAASAVGIVTRFTLRTYPLETITGGLWLMEDDDRYSNTRKLIKKARDMVLEQDASGNRKLTGFIYYGNLPPDPGLDPERHHKPCTIVLAGAWGGDDEAAAMVSKLVDRDICIGKPPAPMPFNVLNQLMGPVFLTFPRLGAYYKGVMGHEVPDDRIDAAADLWATHDRAMGTSTVGLDFFGGRAGTEFGTAITAGGHDHCVSSLRNFTFGVPALVYFPNTPAMYEQGRDLSRKLASLFQEYATTSYSNFHSDFADLKSTAEQRQIQELMISNRTRLHQIKTKVDAKNVFSRVVISTD
jgi:hypothetical protein